MLKLFVMYVYYYFSLFIFFLTLLNINHLKSNLILFEEQVLISKHFIMTLKNKRGKIVSLYNKFQFIKKL